MPKVSIIVPVYNVDAYLKECIDSILDQTLTDIEIILVDDGSTDRSCEICDHYSAIDARIKTIHKPHEGLSCARNDGIELAVAPYIMFVDSDDWVDPDFCMRPYTVAEKNNADLVLFTFNRIFGDGTSVLEQTNIKEGNLSEAEAMQFNVCFTPAAWLGLYAKELFLNVRFPVGKYYEEFYTSHKLIHVAKKIFLLNEPLYYYRADRIGSITNDSMTKEHPDRREMIMERIEDLHRWGYEEYALMYAFPLLIKYGQKGGGQEYLAELAVHYIGRAPSLFSIKRKILFEIYRLSPLLFDVICIVLRRRVYESRG